MALPFVLALGGTRSGKSRFGLATTVRLAAGGRAWFLATAWPGDPELDDRIRRHRQERPADWPTIDVGPDLAAALAATQPDEPALIDGYMLWLSGLAADRTTAADTLDVDAILDGPVAAGLAAIRARPGPVVIVSDEIGGGVVPMDPWTRAFRDLVGMAHQRLAAEADTVACFVAGLPVWLKGGPS